LFIWYFEQYDKDRDDVLARARTCGLVASVQVGVDIESSQKAIDLADAEADVFATVGWHPHSAHLFKPEYYTELKKAAKRSLKVVAIGEIGLDYYKSEGSHEVQMQVFAQMLDLAAELKLPVVIHSRESFRDTIKVLHRAKIKHPGLKVVFHCYSYDSVGLEAILQMGFMVSFTANITYKSAKQLQGAVEAVPLDRFMTETDAPYLAPQTHRGKRNEPAFVKEVVAHIAQVKGVPMAEIKRMSVQNAVDFFNLPAKYKEG